MADVSTMTPLERAQQYVADLTAAQKRGVTTTSSGQPVAATLAKYQATVAALTASGNGSTDGGGGGSTVQVPIPAPSQMTGIDYTQVDPTFNGMLNGRTYVNGVPLTVEPGLNTEYNAELATFTQAQTAALAAAGKPAGVDGAERGSLTAQQNFDLAKSLNLPLLENQFLGTGQAKGDAAVGTIATAAPAGGNASSLVPSPVTTSQVTSQGSGTTTATAPMDTGTGAGVTSGGSSVTGAGGGYDAGYSTTPPATTGSGLSTADMAFIAIGVAGLLLTMHKRKG